MKKQIILILFIMVVFSGFNAAKPSLRDLTTIPTDSLKAEQTKIWVPVEVPLAKVKIFIRDRRRVDVRHLFHDLLQKGYYNFYWDKKDDSGRFVTPGKYNYYIFISKKLKIKKEIVVTYKPGENLIYFEAEKFKPNFEFEITKDSVLVSFVMKNNVGVPVDTIFTDSTFNSGTYQFNWKPTDDIRYGRYQAQLTVDGYPHIIYLRHTK